MATLQEQLKNNLRLQQRLHEQATRDPLTKLYNRRYLDELLPTLTGVSPLMPIALVMIDLDHFKQLNDNFGHKAGDAVLRAVGNFLLQHVRPSDYVFRMGGEEILTVLMGMTDVQAQNCLEAWRREFKELPITCDDTRLAVTFSAGIAVFYSQENDGLDQVLNHADHALYQAKADGRNCSRRWSGEAHQGICTVTCPGETI